MKRFLPASLRDCLACLLLLALTALVVRVFVSAGRIEERAVLLSSDASTAILEARGAISDYRQTAEDNKKAITATIELGAVLNGSGRLFNTQVLPRLMKTADASTVLLSTLNENAVTLNRTIANLDDRVSGKEGVLVAAIALLKGLDSTAERLGVTAATLDRMLSEIGSRANLSLDAVYELLGSPQWHQALQNATIVSSNLAKTSERVDATAEEVRKAMGSAPGIARNLERISQVTSKWAKAQIIVTILASVARAFLP